MTFRSLFVAGALLIASAFAGSAATYTLGDATTGATASHTLKVQTVDFLTFSLDAPAGFALTGLTISLTSLPGSNFRESLALYSGSDLVASIGSQRAGDGVTLSFGPLTAPANGSYTLAVAGWKAFFTPDIANARSTAFFNNGRYSVVIDPTISAVPLPAGGVLLLAGLGAFALVRRHPRQARAAV